MTESSSYVLKCYFHLNVAKGIKQQTVGVVVEEVASCYTSFSLFVPYQYKPTQFFTNNVRSAFDTDTDIDTRAGVEISPSPSPFLPVPSQTL